MKMTMLLLISTVAMLVGPAVASPTHHTGDNLNRIIELAENYGKSVSKVLEEYFVDDVTDLGERGCEDTFFCKVYDILHKLEQKIENKVEHELVRNLKIFVDGRNVNCTVLLEGVTPKGVYVTIPKIMDSLKYCIQHRNIKGKP